MSNLCVLCGKAVGWLGRRQKIRYIYQSVYYISGSNNLHSSASSSVKKNPADEQPVWLQLHNCKTRQDLHTQLMENTVYEDKHILALNKPGGIPMIGVKYEDEECTEVPEGEDLSIAAVLPDLQKALGCQELKVLYSQPRLFSGIIVLSKTDHASKTLAKYFKHTRINKVFYQTYWSITIGMPIPAVCEKETFGLRMEYIDGWKIAVLENHASLRQRKMKRVVTTEMNLKTLSTYNASQHRVALVELCPTSTKWDALQLFLLHKLAPALGDHKYSCRLKEILGRPTIMEHTRHLPTPQVLPYDLQKDLGIHNHLDTGCVPLHMHCCKVDIPRVVESRSHRTSELLHLRAPLPQFFKNSLNRLHLNSKLISEQL